MYLNTNYQEKLNKEALDFTNLPDKDIDIDACTIRPQLDKFNGTVNNESGVFVPEYRMFVNDQLSAIPRHLKNTFHFIASSFKSVYIILGYPGPITKPDLPPTMSWGKMVGRAVGPLRLSLGVEFLNRGRRSFQVLPTAVLIGNVYTATLACVWLWWSLHQLISTMKDLIKRNFHRLA